MRQISQEWSEYVALRTQVVDILPDNLDVSLVKPVVQSKLQLRSKRRFERINSVRQLIEELERHLIIFPEKKGIMQLKVVLDKVNSVQPRTIGPELMTKVEELTKKLEPVPRSRNPSAVSVSSTAQYGRRVPESIRYRLAYDLELMGGKDWEHFCTGLGHGLKEKDRVRIRQGEVDRIEKEQEYNIIQIVDKVLTKFEDRCMQIRLRINLLDHLISILQNEDIFQPPLNKIARFIKEEKKKMENFD